MENTEWYITANGNEVQEELKGYGFSICDCCGFDGSEWLHIFERNGNVSVHGTGFGCENECAGMCPSKCIRCSLTESITSGRNVLLFSNVKDFKEAWQKIKG